MTLRIQLFGPFQATWQGQPLLALRRPRLQALCAYLLLRHRHRPAPRDHLAFTFWPDMLEDDARTHLRRHLYLLRQWLPPSSNGDWFIARYDDIRLNPHADLWVDVWAFEDGLTQGEAELAAAVELVSADLLPYLSDAWLALERERLRRSYARALVRLITLSQARCDWIAAIHWTRRLIAHDPLNEEVHRLLIALHYASGNRPAALQQFEVCQRLLRQELGIAPMPETLALRDAILRGQPLDIAAQFIMPLFALHSPAARRPSPVVAPPGHEPRAPAPSEVVPFVGREPELQRLAEAWGQAARGAGSLLLIGGEAGVGKSRLLHEIAAHARRRGARVLWGRCYEFEHASPYQPVADLLRADLPRLALSQLPPLWLAEAARLLPELRERRPDLPDPSRLEPEHEQSRLVEGLCRCLLGLSYQQSLLVLLDDLHWATESTLTWLHTLARHLRSASILVVAAYRQEEVGLGHRLRDLMRELRREGWGAPLLLQPLAGDTTHELVKALSGLGEAAVGPSRRLYAESEGNPFFLLELIKHLEETGQLRQQGGCWAGPWVESAISAGDGGPQVIPPLPLPESVREIIQARLERLGESARALLDCAAVAGREFDIAVVRAALDWPEDRVLRALEELLERGLVHERDNGAASSRDYAFSHHLVQEVTYEGLTRARREALHRWLGQAMAKAYGAAAAAELAHHFERGGARDQALQYLKLAGDQAAARYANSEALNYYGRALSLLGDTDQALRFDLLMARAEVWELLGRREEQRTDLEGLMDVASTGLQSGAGLGADASGNARERGLRLARTYALWADFYEEISDHAACARAARSALTLFQRAGDQHGEAQSLYTLGLAAYRQGDYRAARDYYERALALRQEIGDRAGQAASLNALGNLMRQTGEYAIAQAHHEQALALCRSLGDRPGEAESLRGLGALYLLMGRYSRAQAYYEEGLALCRAISRRRGEAAHLQGLAFLAIIQGDYDTARTYQHEASTLYEATGDQEGQVWTWIGRGQLAWHLGSLPQARQSWEQALDLAQRLGTRRLQIWAMNDLGNLAREMGETQAARRCLEEALRGARLAGDRRFESCCLHHLGQLAWAEGDITQAGCLWRDAAALRTKLGLTTFADASRARLAEAVASSSRGAEGDAAPMNFAPMEEARRIAQAVWIAWRDDPPSGEEEDEVRQGYLALARTFKRLGEPRAARDCLEQAHAWIQSRARRIADAAARDAFLAAIPINHEIETELAELTGRSALEASSPA